MDNIIRANEKREHLLNMIAKLGFVLFILTGFIGCNAMKSGGTIFGWIFVVLGILITFVETIIQMKLKESGGALTLRKLSDNDLMGLKKEELEKLRFHIYAKHGYNFNVNDILFHLENIASKIKKQKLSKPTTISQTRWLCNQLGCSDIYLLMSFEDKFSLSGIEKMTEIEKEKLRRRLELRIYSVLDDDPNYSIKMRNRKLGSSNRYGMYGHEGMHYYDFIDCDWYKPTTCNIEEVYNKMSDIEKYNVEFLKATEARMQ